MQMPVQVQCVLARPQRNIPNQVKLPLQTKHPTLVSNWIWKTPVPVMTANEEIEVLSRRPGLRTDLRQSFPGECGFGLGLVRAIDHQGVMKAGSSKQISFRAIPDILASAGINQQRLAGAIQTNAERVGVPVSGRHSSLMAAVNHQLLTRVAGQQINSARL